MNRVTKAGRPLLLAILAGAFACPALADDRKSIRIGSGGSYPPFSYIDSNHELQGFEIDLAKAICAAEKVTCEFVAQSWQDLIPALLIGRIDVIFASLAITDERMQAIMFSNSYYRSPALFVAGKANGSLQPTPEALSDKTVGAQIGTVSARFLKEVYAPAGVDVRLYATQDEANLELASGRLDAVLAHKLVMLNWLEKTEDGECCQVVGPDFSEPKRFGSGFGAGVRKGDEDLREIINRGLAAVRKSGEYDRINARYFPFSIY